MSQIKEYAVELTFETDKHGSLSITVPNAEPSVTDTQIITTMTRIIDAEAVTSTAGEPIAIKKAELIETDTMEYDLN